MFTLWYIDFEKDPYFVWRRQNKNSLSLVIAELFSRKRGTQKTSKLLGTVGPPPEQLMYAIDGIACNLRYLLLPIYSVVDGIVLAFRFLKTKPKIKN